MMLTLAAATIAAVVLLTAAGLVWRFVRRRWRRTGTVMAVLMAITALPAVALSGYLVFRLLAGQPAADSWTIGPGAAYARYVLTGPNRAVVHVVELTDPARCRFQVTPPIETPDGFRNAAGFATDAARSMNADIVINASFFGPFYDNWFLDAYPHPGDIVEPVGTVISDGVRYGKPKPTWVTFWVDAANRIGLGNLPDDTRQGVTGRQWLLRGGAITAETDSEPYPRTAIATDAGRQRLWLVVVDGKQPRYSDGLTYRDLAGFLVMLGATDAIELDGGGSSILVAKRGGDQSQPPAVLSRPCHTKIPGRQRPTAVFLGVTLPKSVTTKSVGS